MEFTRLYKGGDEEDIGEPDELVTYGSGGLKKKIKISSR